jgi:hypothetical protein
MHFTSLSCSAPPHGRPQIQRAGLTVDHIDVFKSGFAVLPIATQVVFQGEMDIVSTSEDIEEQNRQIGRSITTIVNQAYAHMDFVSTVGVCCCSCTVHTCALTAYACVQSRCCLQVDAYLRSCSLGAGFWGKFSPPTTPYPPLRLWCLHTLCYTQSSRLAGWTTERCLYCVHAAGLGPHC